MLTTSANIPPRVFQRTSNKSKDNLPLLQPLPLHHLLPPPHIQELRVLMSQSTFSNKLPRLLKVVVVAVEPL